MPKLKHVAVTTHDVEETAKFYIEVFGMKEVGKIDGPGTTASISTAESARPGRQASLEP
jgi:catechol 2,3-dioxygenase-like lactoylglutathione lyase family enzyme